MGYYRTFLPTEFSENKLKILSLVALNVTVKNLDGAVIESFETIPSNKEYMLQTELHSTMIVEVSAKVDETVEFYPVITAV